MNQIEELQHQSVLLQEAIEQLAIQPNGIYVDGTFGRGGHSAAILQRLGSQGRLIAFDKDPSAVEFAARNVQDARFEIIHSSFAELYPAMSARGLVGLVNGVLLDLGMSSPQLDEPERGFSFMREGALDMRMNPHAGVGAAEWISQVEETQLAEVLFVYGEERHSRRIARAIVAARTGSPILTTTQLANIVAAACPSREKGKHPATRTFQAIRIYINRELEDLESCLPQAQDVLAIGGRLAVISFHSLEDRIVKQFMRKLSKPEDLPRHLPIRAAEFHPQLRIIGKAIKPSEAEIKSNVRARSAILRIAEKLR